MLRDPSHRTGYLAWQLSQAMAPRLEKALRPLDLTLAQQNALLHVSLAPGVSSAEVARRSGVTAQSMGAAVNALIDRGLLERSHHPGNRRVLWLRVTDEGLRLAERAQAAMEEVEARAVRIFSAEEQATAQALLHRLVDHLNPDALRFDAPAGEGEAGEAAVAASGEPTG
ncbi:MarR family winged helix-turn-helix transcriptional regulator [Streptomyces sp. H27-D2]|uniref:MarR family winged helix-turn-helix transcriptional regulator n=1 Tax=Streptomyces sp. H27-D2 TaxID=3046304 RepID=UPI002DBCF868|nr:MarR family transcriptional regulator [Streptomyces sp. H27-D2]MEC4020392.1 MarR family transcriptional regulator [Streptomyces sp. H27-D2]